VRATKSAPLTLIFSPNNLNLFALTTYLVDNSIPKKFKKISFLTLSSYNFTAIFPGNKQIRFDASSKPFNPSYILKRVRGQVFPRSIHEKAQCRGRTFIMTKEYIARVYSHQRGPGQNPWSGVSGEAP